MRRARAAAALLLLAAAGCGDGADPVAPEPLTPELVRGVWDFTREGTSACAPLRITLGVWFASEAADAQDQINAVGEWVSTADSTQTFSFLGTVRPSSGAFDFLLTVSDRMAGSLSADGQAEATVTCTSGGTGRYRGTKRAAQPAG